MRDGLELAVGEALANAHDHSGAPGPMELAIASKTASVRSDRQARTRSPTSCRR